VLTRPRGGQRALVTLAVVLLGLAGSLGAAVVTRAGAGLDADSVTYLDAAQNLSGGRGLTLTPGLSVESDRAARRRSRTTRPSFRSSSRGSSGRESIRWLARAG
jgi:hypothetical protein